MGTVNEDSHAEETSHNIPSQVDLVDPWSGALYDGSVI